MKHARFAIFYHMTTARDGHKSYQEACGDRSVVLLDGRRNLASHHENAKEWGRKHKYDGYRIARGTFTNPFILTAAVIPVEKVTIGGNNVITL